MFFESVEEIQRILMTSLIVYPLLILVTLIVGKRSFAKMNNFDWIVTVALGAILGSSILLKNVKILEVVAAVGCLLALQYTLTLLSSRFFVVDRLIKTTPTLLFKNGHFLDDAMMSQRISRKEVESVMRKAGFSDINQVYAVVFETGGEFSVISTKSGDGSLLNNV